MYSRSCWERWCKSSSGPEPPRIRRIVAVVAVTLPPERGAEEAIDAEGRGETGGGAEAGVALCGGVTARITATGGGGSVVWLARRDDDGGGGGRMIVAVPSSSPSSNAAGSGEGAGSLTAAPAGGTGDAWSSSWPMPNAAAPAPQISRMASFIAD